MSIDIERKIVSKAKSALLAKRGPHRAVALAMERGELPWRKRISKRVDRAPQELEIKEAFDRELWEAGVREGAFSGYRDPQARWYLAEAKGIKVAFGNAVPGPGDLTTISYYVLPEFRKLGYGTKLASYIADRSEKASFLVKKDNEASIKIALSVLRGKYSAMEGRHVVRLTKEAGGKDVPAKLSGGLAEGKPDSEFDPKALARGTKVEMEHTDDPETAKRIAKDHLVEHPDYYKELAKMEQKMERTRAEKAANILRWALSKQAQKPTYPISRALTNPLVVGGLTGIHGAATAALAGQPELALVAGGVGGGFGYLMQRLQRWLQARALLSRALRGDPTLMKSELKTLEAIKSSSVEKRAAPVPVESYRYPFSELLTSRMVRSILGGLSGAVSQNPAMGAALGATLEGTGATVQRILGARGLRGRLALGGEGLYPMEMRMIEELRRRARHEARKSLAKRIALGAGLAAGAGAGAMGVKKLVVDDATA